ncbi:hypothetical protein SAMN05421837_102445 [Amycolatopsis pretoriensis]|uniref:Uncharacterized protein n=1 Tax=Amycolatopsis pretoriensis TaxID=218821 RepID=A0A1H5QCR5_9PSEU|nr:hypothetical protein [Amycolatopsis pretoriensis]SEF23846.1 hypothetical protein SAMN05421837_102445 [Amycolatopsis pretoriensis]
MAETLAQLGIMAAHEVRPGTEMDQVVSRILEADDADEADLQMKYETLVAVYKLKRLLTWTLVVIPLILLGLGVVLYLGAAR